MSVYPCNLRIVEEKGEAYGAYRSYPDFKVPVKLLIEDARQIIFSKDRGKDRDYQDFLVFSGSTKYSESDYVPLVGEPTIDIIPYNLYQTRWFKKTEEDDGIPTIDAVQFYQIIVDGRSMMFNYSPVPVYVILKTLAQLNVKREEKYLFTMEDMPLVSLRKKFGGANKPNIFNWKELVDVSDSPTFDLISSKPTAEKAYTEAKESLKNYSEMMSKGLVAEIDEGPPVEEEPKSKFMIEVNGTRIQFEMRYITAAKLLKTCKDANIIPFDDDNYVVLSKDSWKSLPEGKLYKPYEPDDKIDLEFFKNFALSYPQLVPYKEIEGEPYQISKPRKVIF